VPASECGGIRYAGAALRLRLTAFFRQLRYRHSGVGHRVSPVGCGWSHFQPYREHDGRLLRGGFGCLPHRL